MYGQTRHDLQRLARIARAGGISAPELADRIDALLEADWRRVEKECEAVRRRAGGSLPAGTTSAALSVPREKNDEDQQI